jgi:hypothetical protein
MNAGRPKGSRTKTCVFYRITSQRPFSPRKGGRDGLFRHGLRRSGCREVPLPLRERVWERGHYGGLELLAMAFHGLHADEFRMFYSFPLSLTLSGREREPIAAWKKSRAAIDTDFLSIYIY